MAYIQKAHEKLYPCVEINAATRKVLEQSDNKENYFMTVLKRNRCKKDKHGRCVRDENGMTIQLPEREVSLEKLLAEGWNFLSLITPPEQWVIAEMEREELHRCICSLPANEKGLIYALYFSNYGDGMSVRKYAKATGIPFTTIQSRKKKRSQI